ncbi:MAG: type II toxin-antitoxin system RelE/ParE family toxin [Verrucomicrobiota bacterium]
MNLFLHPRVRSDIREALEYYDTRSDSAGDRLFAEVEKALDSIELNPDRYHFSTEYYRRCNLIKFPYHFLFEIWGSQIRVLVFRHHKRHPDYGLQRRW